MNKLYYDDKYTAMAALCLIDDLILITGEEEHDRYSKSNFWMVAKDWEYRCANEFPSWDERMYVHPDSEHIFEPQAGDLIKVSSQTYHVQNSNTMSGVVDSIRYYKQKKYESKVITKELYDKLTPAARNKVYRITAGNIITEIYGGVVSACIISQRNNKAFIMPKKKGETK